MKKYILLYSILVFTIIGCEDIIEPDLSDKTVVLLSPPDTGVLYLSTIAFWWEEVEDAINYNLQIVSPSFDYIERLYLDTIITTNKHTITLLPGNYQWRVRAGNNTTKTDFTTFSLTIDSTADISQEIIQLLFPVNYDTTNATLTIFSWNSIYNAEEYNFRLFQGGGNILSKTVTYDTIIASLDEGSYRWEVRGQNSTSNTMYSSFYLFIDTTQPAKPELILPLNDAVLIDSAVFFDWIRDESSASSIKDSIFIYKIENQETLVQQLYLSISNCIIDTLGPGEYSWRVISIDRAGNKSDYSDTWFFIIE
jgi:hypothetical protein